MLSSEKVAMSRSTAQSEAWVAVVDDDASIRCSLARVFRVGGIHVETFASAEEFLECTTADEPRCIVLDVHLGALSGFELQDRLTELGWSTPIIFITAHEEIPSSRLERRAGACGYLRKPFDTDALLALVRPFLCRETMSCVESVSAPEMVFAERSR
ncbi:MAG TPA: response regulator [Gemmatimonadaceae bacterium]